MISAEMEKGCPDGVTPLFVGGRNGHFGNFLGRIAEPAAHGRAVTSVEVVRHYRAARRRG